MSITMELIKRQKISPQGRQSPQHMRDKHNRQFLPNEKPLTDQAKLMRTVMISNGESCDQQQQKLASNNKIVSRGDNVASCA